MPATRPPLIRKVRRTDAAAVARLLGELGYPCSADEAAARLGRLSPESDRVYAALVGGRVVGLVALHFSHMLHTGRPWCRITALVVSERRRGRGVGEALLRHAEQCALAAGAGCVEVTCNARRTDAHGFYTRRGYSERRKRFYKALL